ncbi:hypothetical protein niasHT_014376 [Heterodera trifolii]|uniref:Uncharacterized protein n=1 Tax=Heterodera trifolii TaxID=157864 RepID=A0ABD2LH97_9BILA
MSAVVQLDNALALPTRQLKRPLSPPQIAQQVFGSVDGRQHVAFVLNTEESGKTAQLPVSVNAISFLRRLVAQFGGQRLESDDLLEGTLPTADNRAMALECLQMDDDDTHNQLTKHSRAKEVLDRLVGTGRHSSLVVHALMSAVGPIALVTNPQLNMCFEGMILLVHVHGRVEPMKLSIRPIERIDTLWPGISDSDGKELQVGEVPDEISVNKSAMS